MSAEIHQVVGSAVPLLLDDIDTDRIIPARFLRCVTFDGLGAHAFEDDRKQDPNHPFNRPEFETGSILIAGRNFGCGSSREHAPQALMRWGIRAIIAESFAEIFFGNCTGLGIPCCTATREVLESLVLSVDGNPTLVLEIDLDQQTVSAWGKAMPIAIQGNARKALTSGQWDFLGQLLEGTEAVKSQASKIPYFTGFKS